MNAVFDLGTLACKGVVEEVDQIVVRSGGIRIELITSNIWVRTNEQDRSLTQLSHPWSWRLELSFETVLKLDDGRTRMLAVSHRLVDGGTANDFAQELTSFLPCHNDTRCS